MLTCLGDFFKRAILHMYFSSNTKPCLRILKFLRKRPKIAKYDTTFKYSVPYSPPPGVSIPDYRLKTSNTHSLKVAEVDYLEIQVPSLS